MHWGQFSANRKRTISGHTCRIPSGKRLSSFSNSSCTMLWDGKPRKNYNSQWNLQEQMDHQHHEEEEEKKKRRWKRGKRRRRRRRREKQKHHLFYSSLSSHQQPLPTPLTHLVVWFMKAHGNKAFCVHVKPLADLLMVRVSVCMKGKDQKSVWFHFHDVLSLIPPPIFYY